MKITQTIKTSFLIIATALVLQGCVHKIVTVPAKIAYKTTKGVVKGTIAVGKAIIPDGDKKEEKENEKED